MEEENLVEGWERFHVLLRRYMYQRLTRWMQVHIFYNELSDPTQRVIDASIGGALIKKTTNQAYGILEDMATNSNQWPKDSVVVRKDVGGVGTDVLSNLVTHVALLTKQLHKQ